jgi:AcrR family transcriptional regulator
MTREEVLVIQRERIMVAFIELIAAHGYNAINVGHVVSRAGVSRSAFYECFDGPEGCAVACYERFTDVMLGLVGAGLAASDDREIWVASAVEAYLGTLQKDLVVAKAVLIEMDAAGAPARQRRRSAVARYAEMIAERYEQFRAHDKHLGHLPHSAHLSAVYAIRQLACDALEDNAQPDLLSLAPDVNRWMAARDLGSGLIAAG